MANETAISRTYNLLSSTTAPSQTKKVWDVISTNVPTIHHLFDESPFEIPAGDQARFTVFKELITGTGAGPTQSVPATYIQPLTVGEYAFKFLYIAAYLPKQDLILNYSAGENKLVDYLAASMEAMVNSMWMLLAGSVRGIWTANSNDETEATKITGIPSIVKSIGNATGTTGRISRTNAFWQNATTTTNITSFATNGLARYREALMNAKRGTRFPDWGVTNTTGFLNYLATYTATMQLNNPIQGDRFDVGVPDVRLHGLTMFSDANAPANETRFIWSDALKLMLLQGGYMAFSPPMERSGFDDIEIRLRFTGNLFCPDVASHAVVVGSDNA